MLCEVESLTALPNEFYEYLKYLRVTVSLFNEVRHQPYNIYAYSIFYLFDSNCTVCKHFCYYIQSLFTII